MSDSTRQPLPFAAVAVPSRLGGRFVDEGEIDRGGMGTITRLYETSLRRRVACKTLHAEMAARPNEVARFQEEARLTASLDHPNIPAVHETGVDEHGCPYFTMKLVQGQTLLAVLRDPAFSPADGEKLFDVLQIFLKVCDAIAFAHGRGIAHCDLKPMNVMVGAHGAVYVMDWGIARPLATDDGSAPRGLSARSEGSRHVEGTAAYMAPEQAQGRLADIDVRTDVFGLGGLLYRILAGRAPYVGEVQVQLEAAKVGTIESPLKLRRDVALPRRLCDIAMKALATDPADRYQTAVALRRDIEGFLRGESELETVVMAPGHLVCKEGDAGDAAWVIVEGRAQVYKTMESGRRVLTELGPGDVFGETALLGAQIRTASVEATTKLTARVISRAHLERELGRTFWLAQLVKFLADRFRGVNERAARQDEERGEAQTREEILRWVIAKGVGPEVPWGPLRVHLCRTFGRTGAETSALVTRLAGFELDYETDKLKIVPVAK